MAPRQQTIRTYEPTHVERFDDQFWPVLMSLCITATILAATIVTLISGFWMWISLMVLPAGITVLLIALRFIDNRRLRRSFQLAVILSLAAHCGFIIYAKQTNIFGGILPQIDRTTTPVQKQRVIQISQQVVTIPWREENPVPSPDVAEPVPEKELLVETTTVRPQPTPVTRQNTSENPQLVRRKQMSRTVPRLGKSLSQRSRQTENSQPKSSEQISVAKPAPRNPQPKATKPEPSVTEIVRSSSTASSRTEKATRSSESPSRPNESRSAKKRDRERPSMQTSEPRISRRETSNPSVENATPRKNIQAPVAASQPESPRAASRLSDAANLERRSSDSPSPTQARVQRSRPATSETSQLSERRPTRQRQTPSVASPQPPTNRSRSATNSASPTTPRVVERPRPATQSRLTAQTADMNPQPLALERSSKGTAGVGRTANFDRNSGSRQSSAMTPSDSMRRREESTRQFDPNSISLRQMARVPRSAASAELPSAVNRPDSVPLASRAATDSTAELTASSSASLTQSNSDARRGDTSVSKGAGSVDLGPQKIVSESPAERVEGGGQPRIQERPVSQQSTQHGDQGASAPSIATETIDRVATDRGSSSTDREISDTPVPSATADILARSGGLSSDSGAPIRSDNSREDRANTSAADLADSSLGRANRPSDSRDDDEEEERRRRERAQQLAQSSRRLAGSDMPTIDTEIERAEGGAQAQSGQSATGSINEMATGLTQRFSSGDGGGGVERSMDDLHSAGTGESDSESTSERSDSGESTPSISGDRIAQSQRSTTSDQNFAEGDTPQMVGRTEMATGLADQITDDETLATLDRSSPPGMALDIDSKAGPAGIGNKLEEDVGIDSRRGSRDSPVIQSMSETRFRKRDVGGTPAANSAPVIAKEAFRSRGQPSGSRSAPMTEAAIELGLAFLARQQQEDGSWTLHGIAEDNRQRANRLSSDTAATGLAILAFQGAGYNHKEFKYSGQLHSAISWLMDHQQDTGELYVYTDNASDSVCRLYSHGIATLALAEAYGMTQDEEIRLSVQLALDYIAESQHERLGGWRYRPGSEADTSVTGWMMMAMQSAKLAGVETDKKTWDGIKRWLRLARSPSKENLFRYNPEALDRPETRHGRDASPCMTAVGLLMHVYLGWDRRDPRLTDGADYILQHLPDDTTITKRDTYYWYYATQIIRHIGGKSWEKWHGALHPLLVGSQIKDGDMAGSWDPLNPVPDRWGAQAGRLYVTAMNLLSLEVDYRLLPLHDDTVK